MKRQKRYVGIFGGAIANKGAQAMTYISVNEIKKRYPYHEIVMFAILPGDLCPKIRNRYSFTILKDIITGASIRKMLESCLKKRPYTDSMIEQILMRMDFAVDISGYYLGMNHENEYAASIWYLYRIYIMKKYHIRYYIMPQSFGPFYLNGIKGKVVRRRITIGCNSKLKSRLTPIRPRGLACNCTFLSA